MVHDGHITYCEWEHDMRSFIAYFMFNLRFRPCYVIGADGYATTYGYVPR
jgi:hypothetical protein